MRTVDRTNFDVIVLGTGIAGTMLSTILARNGWSVLMIDSGVHPRFAVGESTIPQTSQLITMLGREFGVPEFSYFGLDSPHALRKYITCNCGIKRVFGFVYHGLGEEHNVAQAHQFGNVWRDENHLFRQDIDSYLFVLAMQYGAQALQGTNVEGVDIDDAGVQVTAGGRRYSARFVADGSGFRSVLAAKYDLHEKPCPMVSATRSIFTHVVDVKPFEDSVGKHLTNPWALGTLHHIFKRGWFWVIPFNNWEGAPNPLVSVGVTVDERAWPENPALSPEEEFDFFLKMLPSAERQFVNAKAVRPWVRTKRIQYLAKRTIGKRFALLSHAAGFIDPLFSRGLINTMENLRSLSKTLLQALKDDDFSEERFEHIDVEQKRSFRFADRLVAGGYAAWDDFDMWNAWVRLWAVGVHGAESNLGSVLLMGKHARVTPLENPAASIYEDPGFKPLFEGMWGVMEKYEAKQLSPKEAARGLWSALGNHEFKLRLPDGVQHQEWALTHAGVRDIFLGQPQKHERWASRLVDVMN